MPVALALSPHLDDAAFSCGGLLATLARDWRVVVATVFTASVPDPQGFALACQLDKGLGPEVDYMALRRQEDIAALGRLSAEAQHLLFPEAPHRGYESAPALFADTREDDRIGEALVPAFGALLDAWAPDLILAPQGIGGHVDHVQVVRAWRRLDCALPCLWWRDFPYTVRDARPKVPLAALFADLDPVEIRLDAEASRAKGAACAAYASQTGFQFGGEAGLAARLAAEGGVERLAVRHSLPPGLRLPTAPA